jgi:hypothetical protein
MTAAEANAAAYEAYIEAERALAEYRARHPEGDAHAAASHPAQEAREALWASVYPACVEAEVGAVILTPEGGEMILQPYDGGEYVLRAADDDVERTRRVELWGENGMVRAWREADA